MCPKSCCTCTVAFSLTLVLVALLCLPPAVLGDELAADASADSACQAGVCVLASSADGLRLRVTVPQVEIVRDEQGQHRVLIEGWEDQAAPGDPAFPGHSILIAVPPHATPHLSVSSAAMRSLGTGLTVAAQEPAAFGREAPPGVEPSLWPFDGAAAVVASAWAPAPAPERDPSQIATLGPVAVLRDLQLVALHLTPLQYNPATGDLAVAEAFEVGITFDSDQVTALSDPAVDASALPQGWAASVVNAEQALNWPASREDAQVTALADSPGWSPPAPALKLSLRQEGLYRLTYEELVSYGLLSGPTSAEVVRLTHRGEECALEISGAVAGQFAAGAALSFYATPDSHKYATSDVYWLSLDGAPGARWSTRGGAPPTSAEPASYAHVARFEQNRYYLSYLLGADDFDRWTWDFVFANRAPASKAFTFALDELAPGDHIARLRVAIFSNFESSIAPDHHHQLYVNDHLVDEGWWDGIGWRLADVTFDQAYLQPGTNTLRLSLPNDTGATLDFAILDWFEVTYQRSFVAHNGALAFETDAHEGQRYAGSGFASPELVVIDVTTPRSTVRLDDIEVTGEGPFAVRFADDLTATRRYLIAAEQAILAPDEAVLDGTSTWRSTDQSADYIIIAPAALLPATLPLAAHRQAQGLRVVVVPAEDVYDEFGYGVPSPYAIRDFISYTFHHWQPPAPVYVLLVGDATSDPKAYMNASSTPFLPAYLAFVDPWMGETSADNRFVTVHGDDPLPDLHIGRLPARTLAETTTMVDKILAYESLTPDEDWMRTVTLVADNADSAGAFPVISDRLANDLLRPPYLVQRTYLGATCAYGSPATACQAQLEGQINAGTLLVNYIGHATVTQWANENLFGANAIARLTNAGRLPILLAMTCYDGQFYLPTGNATAEVAVRAAGRGAIASWSPSGLGLATGHDSLNRGLFQSVSRDGERTLGPATLAGKARLWATGANLDLLETFHLFGDPALQLRTPGVDLTINKTLAPGAGLQAGESLTYTLTYLNNGPSTAFEVVITDALPAILTDVQISSDGASVTLRPGTALIWDVEPLAPGAGGSITVTATLLRSPTPDFVNRVTIGSAVTELAPDDNSAAVAWPPFWSFMPVMRQSLPPGH